MKILSTSTSSPTAIQRQVMIFGGGLGLETFDADYDLVRSLRGEFVRTVLNGEANDQWIVPGIQHVNRVCNLVTEIPHNDLLIEFRVKHRTSSITKIGLARQIKRLLAFEYSLY